MKKRILMYGLMLGALLGTDINVLTAMAEETNNVDLTMDVIDVGQGLSLLFESDGKYLLYDGGDREYSSEVVSYLKKKDIETLDYIIASHYDSDHLNGIVGALNVFLVENIIAPDYTTDTRVYESFVELVPEPTFPEVGKQFELGDAIITIVSPNSTDYANVNDYSIGIRLQCGETSILVTGDATEISELEMVENNQVLDSDILIVGHHGSDTSTNEDFFAEVSPELAVISCGEDNEYLHPTERVMQLLQENNVEVFRTDKQGDIVISTDGFGFTYSVDPCNDYSFGTAVAESLQDNTEEQSTQAITYVLNNNSKKFHYLSCYSVEKIAEKNYGEATESRDELIAMGYSPCGNCKP